MHISCLSPSLAHSLILGLYVRAYIHDEHYCILFHFFTSTSSREFFIVRIRHFFFFFLYFFFCYKRWNFSSIEITAFFFAGREKEKFSVSFHCLVCVCHEDDDEKAEKIFFIFFLFIEGNAIPWSGVMEDNVLKSNASEWHSYVGYILSYYSARERE